VWRKAIAAKPSKEKAAQAHWNIGCIWMELKRPARAVEAFSHAAALFPERMDYRFSLGEAHFSNRNYRNAFEFWLPALTETNDVTWLEKIGHYVLTAGTKDVQIRVGLLRLLPLFSKINAPSYSLTVVWARIAIAGGYLHQALPLLLPLITASSDDSDSLNATIEDVLVQLEAGGDHSGFNALREWYFRADFGTSSSHTLIRCADRLGIMDDEIISLAEKVSNTPNSPFEVIKCALNLIFYKQGSSPALLNKLLGLFAEIQPPDGTLAGDIADMLWNLGYHDRLLIFYNENRELLLPVKERLSVAYACINFDPGRERSEDVNMAARLLATSAQVKISNEQIWGTLAAPECSIAVVGNSNSETGRARGAEIDAHDHVIRFNDFRVDPPFDEDYGRKTTLIVLNAGRSKLPARLKTWSKVDGPKPMLIFCEQHFAERSQRWDELTSLVEDGFKIAFIPPQLAKELIDRHPRTASSGLKLAWAMSSIRATRTGVNYYGFSFTDQIGPHAQSSHYFERSRPSHKHHWQQEAELFVEFTGHRPLPSRIPSTPRSLSIKLVDDRHSLVVTDHLNREICAHGSISTGHDYDVLIVNGGGSMHHDSLGCLRKIGELEEGVLRGKPVFLVNSVWQENSAATASILPSINHIVVRETASQQDLARNHGIDAVVRIDVSYWAELDEKASFTDHAGAIVATDFFSREFNAFVRPSEGPLAKYPYIDLYAGNWSTLVKSLSTAKLLLTGRHRGVFAACRARRPFVALAGDTHKIEALIAMSNLPIPVCKRAGELPDMIKWALKNEALYARFFTWLDDQPVFRLRDLGPPFTS
jgi:tetratricopeptide (TPR) repeat protein